jgi:predicted short-subunit dehydrogenase-like oxidoreductase (DUF2520 family)
MNKNKVSIIGAGKVGSSLGYWLRKAGFAIGGVFARSFKSAGKAVAFIGEGTPYTDPLQAIGDSGIVIIGTPDQMISSVASSLASGKISWEGRVVFHLSGATSYLTLSPLANSGAVVGSFHPLLSFARPLDSFSEFGGCFFALTGMDEAIEVGVDMVKRIGGEVILLPERAKPLYHAAASIGSNFLIVLANISLTLLKECGIKKEKGEQALLPLLRSTLANVEGVGAVGALTGPIVRGDERTVMLHLKAVEDYYPELLPLYREAALFALSLAYENRFITREVHQSLLNLLSDKN